MIIEFCFWEPSNLLFASFANLLYYNFLCFAVLAASVGPVWILELKPSSMFATINPATAEMQTKLYMDTMWRCLLSANNRRPKTTSLLLPRSSRLARLSSRKSLINHTRVQDGDENYFIQPPSLAVEARPLVGNR